MKRTFGPLILVLAAAFVAAFGFAPRAVEAAVPAKLCKLSITGNDAMQFSDSKLTVGKDCTEVELTLTHIGKQPVQVMGHNWTLVKTADMSGVANDGLSAGLPNNYVKPGDARVIAHTKVVGGGQSTTVMFSLSKMKAGESYSYLCTFPGHSVLMKGTFTIG